MVKQLLILCSVIVLLSSCAARKRTQTSVPATTTTPAPVKKDSLPVTEVPVKADESKKTYTIRLLLPLRLDEHFNFDTVPGSPLFLESTTAAMHFYLGAMAAVDSLNKLDTKLKLEVVDVSGDSTEVLRKLQRSAFTQCDLAISMLPSNLQDEGIRAATAKSCPIVIQGNSNTQIAVNNPNVWLAAPANSTQLSMMCQYLFTDNPSALFFAFSRDQRSENILANYMSKQIDSVAGKPYCKILEFNKDKWEETMKNFPKGKRIILIIPTSDESYLQSILNKLIEMEDGYMFRLAGLPTWEHFESVDPSLLAEFSTYIFSAVHIDVDHPRIQKFRKAFIETNHADALEQAYYAYDMVNYFTRNFDVNGKKYENYQPLTSLELPAKGLQFVPVCEGCGRENRSLNILRYGNYKLSRVTEYQR
jgi:hypothetical protein